MKLDELKALEAKRLRSVQDDRAYITALRNNAAALLACAEALQFIDSKIGHFARAPENDSMLVLSLIGDLARRIKDALRALEEVK